jgi:hypothetical protein
MHVLRFGQFQLQTLVPLELNNLEASGVLRDVAVQQVVVYVQQVVDQLSVELVSVTDALVTSFEARIAISSVSGEAVDGDVVGSVHIDG